MPEKIRQSFASDKYEYADTKRLSVSSDGGHFLVETRYQGHSTMKFASDLFGISEGPVAGYLQRYDYQAAEFLGNDQVLIWRPPYLRRAYLRTPSDAQPLEVRPGDSAERADRVRFERKAGIGLGALNEECDLAFASIAIASRSSAAKLMCEQAFGSAGDTAFLPLRAFPSWPSGGGASRIPALARNSSGLSPFIGPSPRAHR
jgi:hypothetical protein